MGLEFHFTAAASKNVQNNLNVPSHLAVDEGPLLFILETLFMFDPSPIHPLPVFIFKLDLTKFEHFHQILTG